MTNILIIFTVLTFINVVFSTIKSIVTIKGGWVSSSLVSGLYYGYYNIVLLYTVADFPLWQKVVVTAFANVIGVALVKIIEMKSQKDKLWKIEMTVIKSKQDTVVHLLEDVSIPFSYIENVGKYTKFDIYCSTKQQSLAVKEILKTQNAKYFVCEGKTL